MVYVYIGIIEGYGMVYDGYAGESNGKEIVN